MAKDNQKNTNRGLASGSGETRTRVAREGGKESNIKKWISKYIKSHI